MAGQASNNGATEKANTRERYKGISPDRLECIPAILVAGFHDDDAPKRVAIYARVSTDDPRQTSSLELQRNHYEDMVLSHPNWTLVGIYADEGVTGTSTRHRDEFNALIKDCEGGKVDLVITNADITKGQLMLKKISGHDSHHARLLFGKFSDKREMYLNFLRLLFPFVPRNFYRFMNHDFLNETARDLRR